MKISIAMATFNGSRFLAEQLDSIANQTKRPAELVAVDDGSTDRTLKILRGFKEIAPFPVKIYENKKNLGFADNFLRAASLCSEEWISFCDQDDIWLPNKLEDAELAIQKNPNTNLILQNAYLYSEAGLASERLFPNRKSPGKYGRHSQFGFWVWLGFLQTFRADLLDGISGIKRPPSYFPEHEVMSHDQLTCVLANATGGIVILPKAAALYRRHASAVTGDYAEQTIRERVAKALPTGSDRYENLADVAIKTSKYLNNLAAATNGERAQQLLESSKVFSRLSVIYSERSRLYAAASFSKRCYFFSQVLRNGGYWGPPAVCLGWKSAAKDIFSVSGVISKPSDNFSR